MQGLGYSYRTDRLCLDMVQDGQIMIGYGYKTDRLCQDIVTGLADYVKIWLQD